MINPLFKLSAIAFLVVSSGLIGSSVTAEPEPNKSANTGSVTKFITNTEVIEKSTSEALSEALPDFQREYNLTISPSERGDFQLDTDGEQWKSKNKGDRKPTSFQLRIR